MCNNSKQNKKMDGMKDFLLKAFMYLRDLAHTIFHKNNPFLGNTSGNLLQ